MTDEVDASFVAQDLGAVRTALDAIDLSADRVSKTLARTFAGAIAGGRSFEETLKGVGLRLSSLALESALKPVGQGLAALVSSALGGVSGGLGGAAAVTPFADGGVVAAPTFFGSNGGLGLMGERGAEAILPLSRGPDGRLGVGVANAARPASIVVNVTTPDAAGFLRSESQIAAALARAVARGQRGL